MSKNPASDLVSSCLQLLRLAGVPCWRCNNGAARIGRRFVRFTDVKGVPDVLAILPPSGRLICVEAKFGSGRLSADQRAWHANATAAGAVCLVVRDLNDLRDALQHLGLLGGAKGGGR